MRAARTTPAARDLRQLLLALERDARDWPAGPVVLGLSGGPDSSALLLALHHLGRPVYAVHVAHHLRAGAAADEQTARALAAHVRAPFGVVHLDGHALRRAPDGWEAAARHARYAALAAAAAEQGSSLVLTAHTGQDRLETLWRGLATGGGLRALQGPLPQRPLSPTVTLVRPLLGWFRPEVVALLDRLAPPGWQAAQDPTNADLRRDRARVRPALGALAADVCPGALARGLSRLQQSASLLDTLLDAIWEATVIAEAAAGQRDDPACDPPLGAAPPRLRDACVRFSGPALRAQPLPVRQELVLRACHRVGGRPSEAFVHGVATLVEGPGRRRQDGVGLYANWRDGVLTVRGVRGRGSDAVNPTPPSRHPYR